MGANRFATMLHRKTHKITVILVYAVLEWILIILLILNSLFSYMITKFADYFGLKPPCLWCSRVDHVFEPGKKKISYRGLVCDIHASEISQLDYCSNHRMLAEAQDMCEDCSSSRLNSHVKLIDMSQRTAFLSLVKDMGMISSDSEKKIENDEKNLRCSCCENVSTNSKLCSPYLLSQPSWGVLDYPHRENLITAATSVDNDDGEFLDPCKFDCLRNPSYDEHESENGEEDGDNGITEEHQMLYDVYKRFEIQEEEGKKDCLRSSPNFLRKELEVDSNISIEGMDAMQSSDYAIVNFGYREDASLEILHQRLENYADHNDHRLVPVKLIDSMTAEVQHLLRCRDEVQQNHGHQEVTSLSDIETQVESLMETQSILGEASTVLTIDESTRSRRSEKFESMEMCENENSSAIHTEEWKGDLILSNQVTIAQATQILSKESTRSGKLEFMEMGENENSLAIHAEEWKGDGDLIHKVCEQHTIAQATQIASNDSTDVEVTAVKDSDDASGSNQSDESNTKVRIIEDERIEQGINHHLPICSELLVVEEEKAPDTPTYVEGIHQLNKKLLLFERRDLGAEESIDGNVVSEVEGGEGFHNTELLKSELKTECKALCALYAELEEERNASAIAANQTMAMITRLQEEKDAMQMEALQYQRMMEEQSEYDQEALQLLNELMVKSEKEKKELEKELEIYHKKVLDYEAKDKMMIRRTKDGSGRSKTSFGSSSNAGENDEQSADLNHEGREEDRFYNHQESSNNNTPVDAVLNLEDVRLEHIKHLGRRDESLADFEEERLSILEQLKALEKKLFTTGDYGGQFFKDIKPIDHILEQNGKEFNKNFDFSSQVNGVVNDFSEDSGGRHYQERRNMGAKAKRLLPLFDTMSVESDDLVLSEEQGRSNATVSHNSSFSKLTLENKNTAIEEEVDHVYARLQTLEADGEILKHCIRSLKKGDKGMVLLQEILQHLRDLKNVELRMMNMGDGGLARLSA